MKHCYQLEIMRVCTVTKEAYKNLGNLDGVKRWEDRENQVRNLVVTDLEFKIWLERLADYYMPKDREFGKAIQELRSTFKE